MIQTRKIGSLTEVYIMGGGKYLTQSYPTNFHQFYTRKVLTGNETIDNYREVTAAERQSIEAEDAKWTEPSQDLIDRAVAAGVVYNRTTGYFEHNGIMDIDREELLRMLPYMEAPAYMVQDGALSHAAKFRTISLKAEGASVPTSLMYAFYACGVESIRFEHAGASLAVSNLSQTFRYAEKLRVVHTPLRIDAISGTIDAFYLCAKLQDIMLWGLRANLIIKDSPLLSVASARCMVANAINTGPISIEVHPDVYAKLSNTDAAAYVPENLLKGSDVPVSKDTYLVTSYNLGDNRPQEGTMITVTIWGELGSGRTHWMVYNSSASIAVPLDIKKVSDGIYKGTGKWTLKSEFTTSVAENNKLMVYAAPSSGSGTSTINKIKLEFGENASPIWTPALSEIADAELREKAEWASVMQMARARQISFITSE